MYNYEGIKKELKQLKPIDFYMKYIVKSYNWYFSEVLCAEKGKSIELMDNFKEIVTRNLDISFHSVQMVGSAKIGFSLSPYKNFRQFVKYSPNEHIQESDIDLAIISAPLFNEIWQAIRKCRATVYLANYKKIANSVFLGYINDKDFLEIVDVSIDVKEKIMKTNKELIDELSILNPISYRIYKSWEDLEEYQLGSIEKARNIL
ncbi:MULTISPECIES: hypothetical protein [Bacillus]|uniref:hypothetical protein n=1 Tax=Bacillus TaxID=1386 RepID=UPI001010D980|nr:MULTISPECIES: hypothetical protein [Bacillus]MDL5613781.1 hypothetical protein [Bacillus halotolerans]MEC0277369.1 hypothetical protein [Bacillus halotolerans]UQE79743.1 hypothetical protein EFK13_03715 [Bacillus cabrialesii]